MDNGETGTDADGVSSGLPFIHGFVLPPAAALRSVATSSPLQIASRSPSPWSVISDASKKRSVTESQSGNGASPGNTESLMDFLVELPDMDDTPLAKRAGLLAVHREHVQKLTA